MESFEIQLLEDRFRIEPLEDGLYRIMEGDKRLGVIFLESEGDQDKWVKWATESDLDEGLIQQIGELITEHNM